VVGRSLQLRDRNDAGAFVLFSEPLPVGTPISLKIDDKEQLARVTEVVESADATAAGMRVRFVSEAERNAPAPRVAPTAAAPVAAASAPAAAAPPPAAAPAAHADSPVPVATESSSASQAVVNDSQAHQADSQAHQAGAPAPHQDGEGGRRRRRRK
jgi:hypothetical protein